jgi:hypothetical protein
VTRRPPNRRTRVKFASWFLSEKTEFLPFSNLGAVHLHPAKIRSFGNRVLIGVGGHSSDFLLAQIGNYAFCQNQRVSALLARRCQERST